MILNHTYLKKSKLLLLALTVLFTVKGYSQQTRSVADFDKDWRFHLGDVSNGQEASTTDKDWRKLNLPHDWSIEGEFSKDNPATPEGGALPGGIGWYRKTFTVPAKSKGKQVYIDFDGVYQKSDVWVNGHHLGFRPNGYISFRYELTSYLKYGAANTIAVKVDNSSQPNSRWYSGSGIYRNVWLVTTNKVAIDHWGTFLTTPKVSEAQASVDLQINIRNNGKSQMVSLATTILDAQGKSISTVSNNVNLGDSLTTMHQQFNITTPNLWSDKRPYLYKAVTKVYTGKVLTDSYTTNFGVRYFDFNADNGFSLNGVPTKILGVCDHHDLGSLGAAVSVRATERQLEILKTMGCNAIRTSHNPPSPELLDLCDKMGFIVMDEAFDVWERPKEKYDYAMYFKEWHKRDLVDQILRDRNHPSVIIWSMGNEIPEQGRPRAGELATEMAAIIHTLDTSRPLSTANNNPDTTNKIIKSGAVDLVGYNYHFRDYPNFHKRYPGKIFIGSETTSALETRGYYDMPAKNIDSIRRWPVKGNYNDHVNMNADNTVSAYDNVSAPWASTHEESWKPIKKYPFLSGMFIWTGFDYLGEPTPYTWPSRSSYFGIIDLAGFPKDVYYMYQSEWTDKTVLHILPHWNWEAGKTIQVWAYYNHADEVELFLNGKSLGKKSKQGEDLHISWGVPFEAGTLKAVSYKDGKVVKTTEIHTAGKPAKIELVADRKTISADGKDMSFVTVKILDKDGNIVPNADNKVNFKLSGNAFIAGVDNGDPVSHDPFKADYRKAFHGLALAILQSNAKAGNISITATADGLAPAVLTLQAK